MPTTSLNKTQTLKRLFKGYIDCITGWAPGDCEALAKEIERIATSMNNELARDALRIIESGGYEL
ncbi:hypothetical protein [Caldivirga sp. MU80]|jgi:hypothetical protein|uniref:hypothetical protein n=1 Tax=Caldivirga sp. MU80 TaxID=1650354 RepID=UPI0008327217|nr:hypothetical protein [Caldivirga sp. MU80]